MHRHQNISATNELLADVQLGNGLPVAVLLDSCSSFSQPKYSYHISTAIAPYSIASHHIVSISDISQHTCSKLFILKHVERSELLRVDALEAKDLDRSAREAALRSLGGALHEQHHGRRSDGLVDC